MKVLLVYKRSTYDFYVLDRKDRGVNLDFLTKEKLKEAHFENQEAILAVEKIIASHNHDYKKVYRADVKEAEDFDLIVAVGGDGTFLEAARCVKNQPIIGVNSDPKRSYGNYCIDFETFRSIMDIKHVNYYEKQARIIKRFRMIIDLDNKKHEFPALNDILICHACPAGLTRYELSYKVDPDNYEDGYNNLEHFCSGIWVSTASGSTGAISSFGGIEVDSSDEDRLWEDRVKTFYGLQFKSLGMNKNKNQGINKLDGDFCNSFQFISKMREGKIYIDGQHVSLDFSYNSVLRLTSGREIRHVVGVKEGKEDGHIK